MGSNKVTDKGLQTVKNLATEFKSKYVGNLLDSKYNPLAFYVRAQYESIPISDAYAFMMSLYPDTADGIDLMKGYAAVDTSNLPVTSDEMNGLRSRLGLGLPTSDKQNVDIYPGNPDLLFTHAVTQNFPGWSDTIKSMRSNALLQFEGTYPNFVQDLKKALNKESDDALTLGNAIFYLDHYNNAIANGKTPSRANIGGELKRQEDEYYKAFFGKGLLGKEAYNRVLANAYLRHVVNMFQLKKQDLTQNNLSDKKIHELKASLDFGSKLTTLTIMKTLNQDIDNYGFTYGDDITFELLRAGNDFSVKSTYNKRPIDLTSPSTGGVMTLDNWTKYMISRMYYGSVTDLQKASGAENPENHLTRDTADSETEMQWWANQQKYEDRVLLKKSDDTTPLSLMTIDQSGNAQPATTTSTSNTASAPTRSPSSSEVTFGSTSEAQSNTALSNDISLSSNDNISSDKTFQFNTLDKVNTFERTQGTEISLARGEQVTLGLDNVATKDVQHTLYKPITFPTSNSQDVQFSNSHSIKLDGSDETLTSPNGKAVQLNHYVPVELDRLKATVNQDNAISLLGANDIPDNHVYSERVRQNTIRGVTLDQGEHYKIDISGVDPENAAVTKTASGSDSVHLEGSSKTVPAAAQNPQPVNGGASLHIGGHTTTTAGTQGPRTGQTPANYPSNSGALRVSSGSTATQPNSYVGSQLNRPGFLTLGGHR